jgi:hypothetical protein
MWYAILALIAAFILFGWVVYHGVKYGFESIEKDEHWYHD